MQGCVDIIIQQKYAKYHKRGSHLGHNETKDRLGTGYGQNRPTTNWKYYNSNFSSFISLNQP